MDVSKLLQLRNLELNTDLHPWDLPSSSFDVGINFSIRDGKVIATGSHENIGVTTAPYVGFTKLSYLQKNSLHYYVASGSDRAYLYDGNVWSDISSADRAAAGDLSVDTWTDCKSGFNLVVNCPQHFLEYWTGDNGTLMQPLNFTPGKTWRQMNYKTNVIRSHKDFLFALGLMENGQEFPYAYRWSHPADTNGLPFSWDEADLATIAGKESIGGDFGPIVDGLSMRDSFCIYTERSVHILDYTGDEFVFRRRLLSQSHGLLATNCVVEAVGKHYFITENDIVVNDGNSLMSILTTKLKALFATVNPAAYKTSFACANPITTELWFCMPELGYTYPSFAIVYNWVTGTFSIRDLVGKLGSALVKGKLSSIVFGADMPDPLPWDEDTPAWDTVANSWNEVSYSPFANAFYGIGPEFNYIQKLEGPRVVNELFNGTLYWSLFTSASGATTEPAAPQHTITASQDVINEIEEAAANTVTFNVTVPDTLYKVTTLLERTNLALEGHRQVTTITRIYPHITSPGPVTFQFGSHDFNNSAIRWQPAIIFNPATDRKIDVRTTGELQAWRVSAEGYDFQLSGFDIEYTLNGLR